MASDGVKPVIFRKHWAKAESAKSLPEKRELL